MISVKDQLRELIPKYMAEWMVEGVLKFHDDHLEEILTAKGSSHNHQAWYGGYHDHVVQCLTIADDLWKGTAGYLECGVPGYAPRLVKNELMFKFENVALVLYFHDIEKIFKYGGRRSIYDEKVLTNKDIWYYGILPEKYGIRFEHNELNALEYIHGEGNDYKKDERVMHPLAAFCHTVDVLSARVFHNARWLAHSEEEATQMAAKRGR